MLATRLLQLTILLVSLAIFSGLNVAPAHAEELTARDYVTMRAQAKAAARRHRLRMRRDPSYRAWVMQQIMLGRSGMPGQNSYAAPSRGSGIPSTWARTSGSSLAVSNPHEHSVRVELRAGRFRKAFTVGGDSQHQVSIPNGRYDVFFRFADEPNVVYQGDSFSVSNQSASIRLQAMLDGNYGLRRVD